jgi:hypothetical protein
MVRGLVSPYPKADLFRRFCAATVDGLVVTTGLLAGARLDSLLLLAVGASYLLLRDALFIEGQSVGKFLEGLGARELLRIVQRQLIDLGVQEAPEQPVGPLGLCVPGCELIRIWRRVVKIIGSEWSCGAKPLHLPVCFRDWNKGEGQ